MERKVFRELESVENAKELLSRHFKPQPTKVEVVSINECVNRVLAVDVEASIDVPPFDRASMDGFALHAEDTFGAEEDKPIFLKVVGKVGAGERPEVSVGSREAVEISTGAPMPKGANAVVMVEYTSQSGASSVNVYSSVVPGDNIMAAGADIMVGELILRKGDFLTPRETGVLAALGLTKVSVFRKPVVAVISTGNEIVSGGSSLSYGKIYDINARTIADSVAENGGVVNFLGIVGDDAEAIASKIREGLGVADLVLTSGGTSAGVGDLLYRIIDGLGKPGILVHGVSARPGKPLIIAVVNGKPVFGLPGYPTSALMMFQIFVRPVLRDMAGLGDVEQRVVEASVTERIFSSGGRREFLPVNLIRDDLGGFTVYPVPGGSGSITTLSEADGFMEIPDNKAFFEAGEKVNVELFSLRLKPADLMIIGSHCIGVDVLLDVMRRKGLSYRCKVVNTGSSGGLDAIRRGEADVAGTHLLDEKTNVYNVPFLERFDIADKVVLVRGYKREQGLVVAKGNPKKIAGVKDIIQEGVSIINRNPGSGTRILLDMLLRHVAGDKEVSFESLTSNIEGYRVEAKSHSAVAVAVLHGKADVGLAIRTVADMYGLDFVPVAQESYDFLVRKERVGKEAVKAFLSVLGSDEFREALRTRTVGLSPSKDTGKVIYP